MIGKRHKSKNISSLIWQKKGKFYSFAFPIIYPKCNTYLSILKKGFYTFFKYSKNTNRVQRQNIYFWLRFGFAFAIKDY